MSNQLRSAVTTSAAQFVEFFDGYVPSSSGQGPITASEVAAIDAEAHSGTLQSQLPKPCALVLGLVWSDGDVRVQPSMVEVEQQVLELFDKAVLAVSEMPRVECKLFSAEGGQQCIPTTSLDEDEIQSARDKIIATIRANGVGPATLCAKYETFHWILNGDAADEAQELLSRPRQLADYDEQIKKLRNAVEEVERELMFPGENQVCPQCLVELHCADLNTDIIDTANGLVDKILELISDELRKSNERITIKFDQIKKDLREEPDDTDQLVAQMTYMDSVKKTELPKLTDNLRANVKTFDFVIGHRFVMPPECRVEASKAFKAPSELAPLMEHLENKLREDRDRFEEDLKRRVDQHTADTTTFAESVRAAREQGDGTLKARGSPQEKGLQDMLDTIEKFRTELDDHTETALELNVEEEQLGWVKTNFDAIQEANDVLQPISRLWTCANEFVTEHNGWMTRPFVELRVEPIQEAVDETARVMRSLIKTFKDFEGPTAVATAVQDRLEKFKEHIPLVEYLCHPGLRDRHWDKFKDIVGYDIKPNDYTTLSSVSEGNRLQPYLKKFEEVSFAASKEYNLEKSLDNMAADWTEMVVPFVQYRDTDLSIVGNMDDIQMVLDDHIVKTQTMKSNSFIGPFEDRTKDWEKTLLLLQDILDIWLAVQATWMYLEPIFGSEDIMKQMPAEGAMFQTVDGYWKEIMKAATADPQVLAVVQIPKILEQLQEANGLLEQIQKGLNDYLETKRIFFARFFFLSNEELLEILSETKDPLRVQPHLKKCFEGIHTLDFQKDTSVTGMLDRGKERVPLCETIRPADANGAVEKWLLETEQVMRKSLKAIILQAIAAYPKQYENTTTTRTKWVLEWAGQAVLAATGLAWTKETEMSIAGGWKGSDPGAKGIKRYAQHCTDDLNDIVLLVRGELTKIQRSILGALVTLDVHARDVLLELAEKGVEDHHDFDWLAQLRYYVESGEGGVKGMGDDQQLKCKMINASLNYGYEYLGNSFRLVVTPLTDRCYRTLMGALHLNFGGAPEGPAGTGKTETTKDLAKAIAKQCVVFNCSDGLDYLAMAKFFKGLGASGAWACFDEFNRIKLEVLSVVAQQLLTILRAITANLESFDFEGTMLPLDPTCCPFITMNPGYAGRSELPDNLKVLFRTVAMMVPNYTMIAQIQLMSYGYEMAEPLSVKITTTYKLCSEQLSSQKHYDYGMRAVKAVLTAGGNLKQRFPEEDEAILILRSIRDVNLCKFLSFDVPLFNGITADLFPGTELPEPNYNNLITALKESTEKLGLQYVPKLEVKCIQLYEMILVRHGLMIVGRPFGCKTTMLRVLSSALTFLAEQGLNDENTTELICLNPKSVSMAQLYGESDPVSQEWQDGVLSNQFRNAANRVDPNRKWIILDGPVDAIWIENMNTVLDDNKKLCLNSGEIVQMSSTMNMIFEPRDLEVASPATVSRCGMIFVEPEEMGCQPLIDSWMMKRPEFMTDEQKQLLRDLFDWLVPPLLYFQRHDCKEPSATLDQTLVVSLMRVMESLQDAFLTKAASELTAKEAGLRLEASFLFGTIWSIGISVDAAGRDKFDTFFRELTSGKNQKHPPPPNRKIQSPIPDRGTLYDYVFNEEQLKWQPWKDRIANTAIESNASFTEIIVPTLDTVRYAFLLEVLQLHNFPVLFVGPTGTGKTAYTVKKLVNDMPEVYTTMTVSFSAQTSANQTQDIIDGKLDKRRKGIFGPPMGKKCIIFVDDLNMPMKEEYGAQPPIEILRQYMDHGGWYDRKETTFRTLVDIQFVAAMGPPGGGRSVITERYSRHFNHISVTEFDDDTMLRIFSTIQDWHFTTKGYAAPVTKMVPKIVGATLSVYKAVAKTMLPTPSKSHYQFNLRDFARVIQGICLTKPDQVPDDSTAVRLWIHEVYRVFYDRLTNDDDRRWFYEYTKEACQNDFGKKFDALYSHLDTFGQQDGVVSEKDMQMAMFSNIAAPETRLYSEIVDFGGLESQLETYLEDYNAISKTPMQLVLFDYCTQHISKISRVLSLPGGNALLVGVGGSGRQSLTKLAAHIQECEVFQIEISKNYAYNDWLDDLKKVLMSAGGDGKSTVFLFNDTQIQDEAFVEDINNLLNAGTVPNLWANDEKAAIMEMVATAAKQEGKKLGGSLAEHMDYFLERSKANLHVVLAFSPIGDAFRERLRKFPSLINCCTIDWFQDWPEEGLTAVAKRSLTALSELDDSTRESCVVMCKHFHSSVSKLSLQFLAELGRRVWTTPTSYLELINAFKSLLNKKSGEVALVKKRYENGLVKLAETENSVEGMKEELIALQPKLVEAQKETADMMVIIEKETEEANKVKVVVEADEAKANAKAAEVKEIKDDCEADLAEAIPVLNSAIAALDTLKKSDIDEVKSMKKPPAGVVLTMSAICTMKGVKPKMVDDPEKMGKKKPDFWDPAKTILGDPKFLQSLKDFDKDNVDAKIMKTIREKYITDENFVPEIVKKASVAAEGLCKWCRAIESYDRVAKVVAPKKAKLKESEALYADVMQKLRVKQAELKEVMDKLAGLQAQFDALKQKQKDLEEQVDLCEKKLDRASKLITSLGGEKIRWTEVAAEMAVRLTNVTGDVLVSSGMIAYAGPFTKLFRQKLKDDWVSKAAELSVPRSDVFSLVKTLGDPVKIREWNIQGLPSDELSTENGIIVETGRRWPLMIDPQQQGNKWVRNMEKENNLLRIKLSGDFLRTLENAIQNGFPVLLEDVGEELDPSLEPLLLKQVFKQGGQNMLRLGDATIEFDDQFRFYITTKLRNPLYSPETAVKVSLVNFMITPAGLEDQLLGIVVAEEEPEKERQKEQLVLEAATNAKKLKELEDQILEILDSCDNILEDETAIKTLSQSKVTANEIEEMQRVAAVTEKEIDEARESYRPIAAHSSILFFNISDLCIIDPMYQYSLVWFISMFEASIKGSRKNSDKSGGVPQRLQNLKDHFTFALYCNVCRSLFEKDKLLFSFTLCIAILNGSGKVNLDEYTFLLTGGVSLAENTQRNPVAGWLADSNWDEICRLGDLEAFDGLNTGFAAQRDAWTAIYDSATPHEEPMPGKWNDLNSLQKLLILRCIRPDKCVPAIRAYVDEHMGEEPSFTKPPPFELKACYDDSVPTAPLIFVLSPGSDPMAALLTFAADPANKMGGDKLQTISLGQGQGPRALQLIENAQSKGTWVVLQNCHLAVSFMPTLELTVEAFTTENCHPKFRMWCTSYPSDTFPVSLLQNGVKMTQEPPRGVKANMTQSYLSDPITDEAFYQSCTKDYEWHKLLFGLCFFHALIQERRSFGALGWNIPYGFNESDLRISIRQLSMFLNEYDETPFEALVYTAGECNYGGRVTDDKDRRVLLSYLRQFYCPEHLEDEYYYDESHDYCAPPLGPLDSIVEFIGNFPSVQKPDVFGLHANADLTKDKNETIQLFTSIIATRSGGASGGSGGGDDELLVEICNDILAKLPADFNMEHATKKYPTLATESMNTVLTQELIRFNKLIQVIRRSLQDIQLALKGLVVMSAELDAVGKSLAVGFVPEMWMKVSYPNLKPLAGYVADLLERLAFFQGWLDNGKPAVFWFSGFFFQPSFLTGALQNFARKMKYSIDLCELEYIFQKEGLKEREWTQPEDGVYVYGLFMEGARFNRDSMLIDESLPKRLYDEMPVGLIRPCKSVDFEKYDHYKCPLYKTLERRGVLATSGHSTNFVMMVNVPSDRSEEHWIKRGVAMFCALRDA
eukprot:COSAG01_NODE_25_length_37050_cov_211.559119_13_plen_3716_part_00